MGTPMSKRYMTEADLLNVADDSCRHELVAGVIVAEPLPTPRHDRVRWRIERLIRAHVETQDLGEVSATPGTSPGRPTSRSRFSRRRTAAGARLVWVVDPERRSVTTYRTLLAPRRLEPHDAVGGEDVLPGLVIPLESIFER